MNMPVLTVENTLASQKDLGQLCADRPLETNEIFSPNAYYGNDLILKNYAGLPETYQLKVVIPHGVVIMDDFVWEAEVEALLPAILCWTTYRKGLFTSKTDKIVIRSASPFLYLVEMLKGQAQPERRGTIFFPGHSTHHVSAQMDFEAMAEVLAHLSDEYKPITVCIYWRDFNLGHHIPFEKRGLPIVSAGHIYDPCFLYRFYHLCLMHWYAASNDLGSQLFYSVKSGCSYFHLDTVKCSLVADQHIIERDGPSTSPDLEAQLISLFNTPRPFTTAEQMKMVDYYLGTDFLRSPRGLRCQLLYAEMLDKFGFFVHNRGNKARFVVPSYYRRTGGEQVVKLAGVGRKMRGLWRKTAKGQ